MFELKNIQLKLLYKELLMLAKGKTPEIFNSYYLALIIDSLCETDEKLIKIYKNYYKSLL